jgi:hypothetical protein
MKLPNALKSPNKSLTTISFPSLFNLAHVYFKITNNNLHLRSVPVRNGRRVHLSCLRVRRPPGLQRRHRRGRLQRENSRRFLKNWSAQVRLLKVHYSDMLAFFLLSLRQHFSVLILAFVTFVNLKTANNEGKLVL